MTASGDTLTAPTLPEGLYEDPSKTSAVATALETVGISNPGIYYPGSNTDVSLARIPGSHVIHVDPALTSQQIDAMASIGLDGRAENAHTFRPDKPVDAICFFRPSGISVPQVLDAAPLADNGVVVWADREAARPTELAKRADLELIGAISPDRPTEMQTTHLDDYFRRKTYDELTGQERSAFHEVVEPFVKLKEGGSWSDVYNYFQKPENTIAFEPDTFVGVFPYKNNNPALFVYRKRPVPGDNVDI